MKITQYLKETKAEFGHVSWPTRKQGIWYTVIVIVISVLTGLFLAFFDSIFASIAKNLIQ